ncbi:hypothetical protein Tco_0400119, partial [Tanacetum coccineum]
MEVVAAGNTDGNVASGCKPLADVVHGSNRLNTDGKYMVRRKVSMNKTIMVWEVEETDFESPIRGENQDDGMMKNVGNSAYDATAEGISSKVTDGDTYVGANLGSKSANRIDIGTMQADTMSTGPNHSDGTKD